MDLIHLLNNTTISSTDVLRVFLRTIDEVEERCPKKSDSSVDSESPTFKGVGDNFSDGFESLKHNSSSIIPTPASPSLNNSTTTGSRRCKCRKSHCLKFYCECFAANQTCVIGECSCFECWNTLRPEHASYRAEAILVALEKNPRAFSGKKAVVSKGCHCKKSGCLKKYCDCYGLGLRCGSMCRCTGCENQEDSDPSRYDVKSIVNSPGGSYSSSQEEKRKERDSLETGKKRSSSFASLDSCTAPVQKQIKI